MSRVAQVRGAKNLTISRLFAEICRITYITFSMNYEGGFVSDAEQCRGIGETIGGVARTVRS